MKSVGWLDRNEQKLICLWQYNRKRPRLRVGAILVVIAIGRRPEKEAGLPEIPASEILDKIHKGEPVKRWMARPIADGNSGSELVIWMSIS